MLAPYTQEVHAWRNHHMGATKPRARKIIKIALHTQCGHGSLHLMLSHNGMHQPTPSPTLRIPYGVCPLMMNSGTSTQLDYSECCRCQPGLHRHQNSGPPRHLPSNTRSPPRQMPRDARATQTPPAQLAQATQMEEPENAMLLTQLTQLQHDLARVEAARAALLIEISEANSEVELTKAKARREIAVMLKALEEAQIAAATASAALGRVTEERDYICSQFSGAERAIASALAEKEASKLELARVCSQLAEAQSAGDRQRDRETLRSLTGGIDCQAARSAAASAKADAEALRDILRGLLREAAAVQLANVTTSSRSSPSGIGSPASTTDYSLAQATPLNSTLPPKAKNVVKNKARTMRKVCKKCALVFTSTIIATYHYWVSTAEECPGTEVQHLYLQGALKYEAPHMGDNPLYSGGPWVPPGIADLYLIQSVGTRGFGRKWK